MKRKSAKHSRPRLPGPGIVVYYSLSLFVAASVFFVASFFLPRPLFPVCANSISCLGNLQTLVENDAIGTFAGQRVTPPTIDLAEIAGPSVLGEMAADGEKHIYVDLDEQTVYAYQGTTQVYKTLVSTGKWWPTPTGEYKIWVKLRSTRMSGGSGADYYNLPNVPYTMFFYNEKVPKASGFSLHGAYWHNNFGNEMSHGCVNLREIDAKILYDWADPPTVSNTTHATKDAPGTIVSICDSLTIEEGSIPVCVIDSTK